MSAPAAICLIALPDLAATQRLAAAVAALARPGDAILLDGPLGAGKTAFARAFLRAAAGDPALEVPSPTFTLVQSYETRLGPVHHFDLWRLDGPSALPELGWDEARDDIVLVEWPDRLGALRPPDALTIALAPAEAQPPPAQAKPPSEQAQPLSAQAQAPSGQAQVPSGQAQPPSGQAQPPSAQALPSSAQAKPPSGQAQPLSAGQDARHATLTGWPDRIGSLP
jgi:tRNA threonylcarbamoyladenosine biosynthesis protein TsaE